MAYTIGGISGCHINPAITLGLFLSGKISAKDCGMYMGFQTLGAIAGSAILYSIASGMTPIDPTMIGANSFAEGTLASAFIAEAVASYKQQALEDATSPCRSPSRACCIFSLAG